MIAVGFYLRKLRREGMTRRFVPNLQGERKKRILRSCCMLVTGLLEGNFQPFSEETRRTPCGGRECIKGKILF